LVNDDQKAGDYFCTWNLSATASKGINQAGLTADDSIENSLSLKEHLQVAVYETVPCFKKISV
jgi:hypothetical protein